MTTQIRSNPRFVKCPKCRKVLSEPLDVPLYKCGGCDTILKAKTRIIDLEKAGSNKTEDVTKKIELRKNNAFEAAAASCSNQQHDFPASKEPSANEETSGSNQDNICLKNRNLSEELPISTELAFHEDGDCSPEVNTSPPLDLNEPKNCKKEEIQLLSSLDHRGKELQMDQTEVAAEEEEEEEDSKLERSKNTIGNGFNSSDDVSHDLRNLSKSHLSGSYYYAYDGSVSSFDGTYDQVNDWHHLYNHHRPPRRKTKNSDFLTSKGFPRMNENRVKNTMSNHEFVEPTRENHYLFRSRKKFEANDHHRSTPLDYSLRNSSHKINYSEEEEKMVLLRIVHELKDQLNRRAYALKGKEKLDYDRFFAPDLICQRYNNQQRSCPQHYGSSQIWEVKNSRYQTDCSCLNCHHRDLLFSHVMCYKKPDDHFRSDFDFNTRRLYPREKYQKHHNMSNKQHFRPVAGGSPVIVCYLCHELLRIPADFLLSERGIHRLRCGFCSEILKFSLENGTHLVPCVPGVVAPPPSEVDYPNGDPVSCSDDYGQSLSKSYSTDSNGRKVLFGDGDYSSEKMLMMKNNKGKAVLEEEYELPVERFGLVGTSSKTSAKLPVQRKFSSGIEEVEPRERFRSAGTSSKSTKKLPDQRKFSSELEPMERFGSARVLAKSPEKWPEQRGFSSQLRRMERFGSAAISARSSEKLPERQKFSSENEELEPIERFGSVGTSSKLLEQQKFSSELEPIERCGTARISSKEKLPEQWKFSSELQHMERFGSARISANSPEQRKSSSEIEEVESIERFGSAGTSSKLPEQQKFSSEIEELEPMERFGSVGTSLKMPERQKFSSEIEELEPMERFGSTETSSKLPEQQKFSSEIEELEPMERFGSTETSSKLPEQQKFSSEIEELEPTGTSSKSPERQKFSSEIEELEPMERFVLAGTSSKLPERQKFLSEIKELEPMERFGSAGNSLKLPERQKCSSEIEELEPMEIFGSAGTSSKSPERQKFSSEIEELEPMERFGSAGNSLKLPERQKFSSEIEELEPMERFGSGGTSSKSPERQKFSSEIEELEPMESFSSAGTSSKLSGRQKFSSEIEELEPIERFGLAGTSSKSPWRQTFSSEIEELEPTFGGSPLHQLMGYSSPDQVMRR